MKGYRKGFELFGICRKISQKSHGFSLIEVLMVAAIVSVMACIGAVVYRGYMDRAKIETAVTDIRNCSSVIDAYRGDNIAYPPSLATVKCQSLLDPWGRPYRYLLTEGTHNQGLARKDKFVVPLNTDYDLYSMGKDGLSQMPLTVGVSKDDIVRANNGGYVSLAENYYPLETGE